MIINLKDLASILNHASEAKEMIIASLYKPFRLRRHQFLNRE